MKKLLLIAITTASLFGADIIVNQEGKQFMPTKIDVKVGDTLVFQNSDSFAHNAYTDDEENEFDTGMQAPGKDIKIPIKAAGTFNVECAIHPNMMLEVNVK